MARVMTSPMNDHPWVLTKTGEGGSDVPTEGVEIL